MVQIDRKSLATVFGRRGQLEVRPLDKVERLEPGKARRLKRDGRLIRIVSGEAWITFDGQDVVVHGGEGLRLPAGRQAVVISALGSKPLSYCIG